jgi:hypothetical protein
MNTEKKPKNFDWVTARAECSADKIFEKLKLQVQENVTVRKRLMPSERHYGFEFVESGSTAFSVTVVGNHLHDSVRFHLGDEQINVRNWNGEEYQLFATLCDDGECRVKVNGNEYDLWQVSKMALEDLLFKKY